MQTQVLSVTKLALPFNERIVTTKSSCVLSYQVTNQRHPYGVNG